MGRQLIGIALIIFGLTVAIYGDRKMEVKGGIILKIFSMPPLNSKFAKWGVALLSIWFGLALVLK